MNTLYLGASLAPRGVPNPGLERFAFGNFQVSEPESELTGGEDRPKLHTRKKQQRVWEYELIPAPFIRTVGGTLQ